MACLALAGCITVNEPFGSASDDTVHEARSATTAGAKILRLNVDGFISAQPSSHALGLAQRVHPDLKSCAH